MGSHGGKLGKGRVGTGDFRIGSFLDLIIIFGSFSEIIAPRGRCHDYPYLMKWSRLDWSGVSCRRSKKNLGVIVSTTKVSTIGRMHHGASDNELNTEWSYTPTPPVVSTKGTPPPLSVAWVTASGSSPRP